MQIMETDIPGWSSGNELAVLANLAKRVRKGCSILELGSFTGRNSWILAVNAKASKVHCVDNWGDLDIRRFELETLAYMQGRVDRLVPGNLYEHFLYNTRNANNIITHRIHPSKFEWESPSEVELLVIDSDFHRESILHHLRQSWPHIEAEGLAVGFHFQRREIRDGINDFLDQLAAHNEYPQVVAIPGTSLWGLFKGLKHAKRWGADFSGLFPSCGDSQLLWPRALDDVRNAVAKATARMPKKPENTI